MIEHLNVEICLCTITNLESALNWLKSTFLFVRLKKNPEYYGFSPELKYKNANKSSNNELYIIDEYLQELITKNLIDLIEVTLVNNCDFIRNPAANLRSTQNGHLMSRYCIAFETMKSIIFSIDPQFVQKNEEMNGLGNNRSLEDLVILLKFRKL